MRSLALILFLALIGPLAHGQSGRPFITDVPLPTDQKGSRIIDMVQDGQETMLFLTRRRLIAFDGGKWNVVPMPSAANSIALHRPSGRVFIGLRDQFGELVLNRKGQYELQLLSTQLSSTDDYRTVLVNDTAALFLGEKQYVSYSLKRNEIIHRGLVASGTPILGGYENQGRFMVNLSDIGANYWMGTSLKEAPELGGFSEERILFNFRLDSLRTLVGTESDRLLIVSGKKTEEVFGPVRNYARENFLSDGVRLSDTTFAISTLAGGIMVIDSRELRTIYTYSYRTGLPDNEIAAVCTDMNGGLWMSHEFGLSRIDLRQPVMEFSTYPGLEGNVQTAIYHRGQLYVGTSSGLYQLGETADLKEIQRANDRQLELRDQQVTQPVVVQPEPEPVKETAKAEPEPQPAEEVKLSRKEQRALKRQQRKEERDKKNKAKSGEKEEEEAEPVAEKPKVEPAQPVQQAPVAPVVGNSGPGSGGPGSGPGGSGAPSGAMSPGGRAPGAPIGSAPGGIGMKRESGLTHIYRRISGIDGKCRQMAAHLDHVLVATNTGLYDIVDRSARPIIKGYILNLSVASRPGRFLASTNNGLSVIELRNGTWTTEEINGLSATVHSAAETKSGVIYLLTDFEIIRLTPGADGVRNPKVFPLPVDQGEDGQVLMLKDVPHFVFTSGMYRLSDDGTSIIGVALKGNESTGTGLRFLKGADGDLWLNHNGAWVAFNNEKTTEMGRYLHLFEGLLNINVDERGDLWVVDSKSHVYRIRNRKSKTEEPFNLYLRRVGSPEGEFFNLDDLVISHRFNSLEFEISAPYYLRSNGTEYQYRLDELGEKWSRWTTNPVIEFPFLQGGTYHLRIRARNVFGQLSEEKVLEFTVEPKLWFRWYFILLYVLVVVGIIFGIIKVRERGLKETQRLLEEMVTKRTSELADEKRKVESLLLNILPKETADELQKKGKATARHYNMVSVMFTDFKGFTAIAEQTDPEDLVAELDRCFVHFDDIIEKYHLEKIKTIGDSYMCAGGVPIRNKSNALAMILAGLEMREYILRIIEEKRQRGEPVWEIRIGIHTGPLTAGVVGKKKFAYDIWGDTVNVASRMESASEAGRINISAATYEHIKHYFECEPRGKVDTKGKGKMEMYFVNGINAKYSVDGAGREPSRELLKIMDEIW